MNTALEYARIDSRIIDVLEQATARPTFGYFARLQENEKKETESLRQSIHSFLGIIPANAA